MAAVTEPMTGRFSVEVELANNEDVISAKRGHLEPARIRRAVVRGVVDSGTTRLVIPESVAVDLGVEVSGTAQVRYADGRSANREIARQIYLSYGGRDRVFNAVVEPNRLSVLIGAIVLEYPDFVVDCTAGRLVPRDPNQIISGAQ
jgi:predicted aspartyl protease